ncbi:hypothetical protein JTB14_028460 [Gonioctena quinquepunctata]|nr:hypothetical protein JTB14_028460 [Gonioctena quinquepunctata]
MNLRKIRSSGLINEIIGANIITFEYLKLTQIPNKLNLPGITGALLSIVTVFFNLAPFRIELSRASLSFAPFFGCLKTGEGVTPDVIGGGGGGAGIVA